jgi:hypothetical protein
MFGLRRIGKSTLRLVATEYLEEKSHPYIFIDGQGLNSLSDLIGALLRGMPEEKGLIRRTQNFITSSPLKTAFTAMTEGTEYEKRVISAYWQLAASGIKSALDSEQQKPVLVIDEFSYLIRNMVTHDPEQGAKDADQLLASMREWRGAGMTMLLTGSIGLTALARKHGLNLEHINDLQPFPVPELTEAEARQFISHATLASEGNWTKNHTDAFLKECGALFPCFLVRGLLEIGVQTPPGPENFPRIFEENVRPRLHEDFYRQFNTRFKEYDDLPNNWRNALIVPALKAVMTANGPCPQDSVDCEPPFTPVDLSEVFNMLLEDGFIHFTEDGEGERLWRPASKLAKLWWKRSKIG